MIEPTPPELPPPFEWPAGGPGQRASCRSCLAPIWWAVNPKSGKLSPMDHTPPDGQTATVSHFATCPNAKSHRR